MKYKLNTEVLLYYYQVVDIYNGKIEKKKKMLIEKKMKYYNIPLFRDHNTD